MADAVLPDVRVAELKKACAAVLRCSQCYDQFVSHAPLTETQCDRCRLQSPDPVSENRRTQ
jgi:hypothetical protein